MIYHDMSYWLMFGEILWLLSILLFSQTGQTGKTVPSICGTNTDYHSKYFCHILVYSIVQLISILTIRLELVAKVNCKTAISYFLLRAFLFTFMSHSSVYVEFGATSSDTIALTHTLGSTTSTLKWNILAQQIPCTANYRCHEFLVQKGTKIVLVWTNDLKGHRQTACSGSPEPQGWCTATTLLEARSVSKDTLD